jgi:hypothetical protein
MKYVSKTSTAIVLRVMTFVGATFGTLIVFMCLGEISGITDGTPLDDPLSWYVVRIVVKATTILAAGHAIALALLVALRRGFASPALVRSVWSGVVCVTLLEFAFVSGTWLADFSLRGLVRLALSVSVTLAICAVRFRSPAEEPASVRRSSALSPQPE